MVVEKLLSWFLSSRTDCIASIVKTKTQNVEVFLILKLFFRVAMLENAAKSRFSEKEELFTELFKWFQDKLFGSELLLRQLVPVKRWLN